MTRRLNIFLLFAVLSSTVGCDRVTKHIAITSLAGTPDRVLFAGIVRLQYAENPGGFLSLGSDLSAGARFAIFSVGTGLLLILVLIIAIHSYRSQWQTAAITLMFAGGASNLADRILRGTVIDFVSLGVGSVRTGVFNLADLAIAAGICMLLFRWSDSSARTTPLA